MKQSKYIIPNATAKIRKCLTFSQDTRAGSKSLEQDAATTAPPTEVKKKTVTELDEELRLILENMSGEGGAAGLEYEDGKPAAMKRSVKNNMFRLI